MKKLGFPLAIAFVISLLLFSYVISQWPDYKQPRYHSECWRGGGHGCNYYSDARPDTGLFAIVDIWPNEPPGGYPMHSGYVKGISDTVVLDVELYNRNSNPFDISSYQPENWFVPVVYDIIQDPRNSTPIADTSDFDFEFKHWYDELYNVLTKPASIPYSGNSNIRYRLKYYIWGLTDGRFRLMMKKTANAPSGFRLLVRHLPAAWITKPAFLADTLNAFAACASRAIYAGDYYSALDWGDSILAYNPPSVVEYRMKNFAYAGLNDSLNMVVTYDSTLAILNRYGDPVMSDSSKFTFYESIWYEDMINGVTMARWMHVTGNKRVFY